MPSQPTTPLSERTFLAARTEFENVFGNVARAKRNWQLVAFALLALLGLVITSYVRLASTTRITPYVVEVDKLGRAIAFGPAEPLRAPDRRVTIAQLATFLKNVRTVVPSPDAQRDLVRRAYAFVDQRGATFLNDYFSNPANDPRLLGERMTRLVEVTSILAVPGAQESSASTWKVQWTETEIPTAAGGVSRTTAWEGYVTVRIVPPERADTIEENPLGLYVSTITWARVASVEGAELPPPTATGDPSAR